MRSVVTRLPEIWIDHGVRKGAQGKNTKNPYPNKDNKEKSILRYYSFIYMQANVNYFIKRVCLLWFLY